MRNKFLKILANPENKKDQKVYADLVKAYGEVASVRQVYHYQLGYTPNKLEGLIYEIKKSQGITDKDIALYDPANDEEDITNLTADPVLTPEEIAAAEKAQKEADELAKQNENPILKGLDEPVLQGLKIRDEYPFLNDENCPDVFKVLVADKITAYKKYAALHAEALEAADEKDAEDKLYELASEAVKNYQLNIDIKDELDHYRDTEGKVLGKHPKLKNMRIEQEIDEMSEADLIKHRTNAMKSLPKYKDGQNPEKFEEWTLRLELTEKNLAEKYNRTFEKK